MITEWQHRLLQLDYLPAGELARRFNLLNPRLHPEVQKNATESSLEKVQWIDEVSLSTNGDGSPLLADNPDAVLFDGHERVEIVLARFGPDALVPVKWYQLSKEETDFALLVKDQTTGMAEYIPERLAELMERTRVMTAGEPRLAGMLEALRLKAGVNGKGQAGNDAEPQIDKAQQLKEKWGVELGQLWQLGEHRLICGDCTDMATVERVMGGEKAEVLFTSPPYSDQREYNGTSDLSISYLAQIFTVYRNLTNYFVVNLGLKHKEDEIDTYWDEWLKCAKQGGLKLLSWNIWDKINATSVKTQMAMFALQHEWIFIFGDTPKALNRTWEKSPESEKREKYYRVNERGQKVTTRRQADGSVSESIIGNIYENKQLGTVFTYYAEMSREITSHPAMFPVELPYAYIEAMTNESDLVIEPFSGSGTTLIACENLNRRCRAVEIDPGYVAVTLQRWADLTGLTPTLVSG